MSRDGAGIGGPAAGLAEEELPLAVVNPAQISAFARPVGRLAKTGRLDAEIIVRFADQVRPEPWPRWWPVACRWSR